ncbi:MAG: hypothetical protein WD070_12215, partial [Pirellulaceae bacterium]
MKRLWVRLGVVAGILGVGGAGVLVAQKSGAPVDDPPAVVAAPDEPTEDPSRPQPIPLDQTANGTDVDPDDATSTVYSNELPPDETAGTAKFVESPSPPQYAGSPTSYSINDSESNSPSTPDEYVEAPPQSAYAPPGNYASDYSSEVSPATSVYASRYGDPISEEEGVGATLGSPREMSDAENRYGDPGESQAGIEPPEQPVPLAAAPELAQPEPYEDAVAAPPTDQEPAPVASNDATIEPPPLRPEESSASSPSAPLPARPSVTQPSLASRQSIDQPAVPPSASGATGAAAASLVVSPLASDTPGDRGLEGTQTPTLTLEKRAPSEVSVGQAAPFKIIVRNVGNVTAHGVVVTDRVPQGTKLVDASPEFTQTSEGAMAWQLGDLEPGDQAQVSIELMPLVEGEIGSVAQVTFATQASVRTVSTKPELVVKHTGPERILIGEDVVFEITLSNPGSGATTGIVIEEDVPPGLAHVAGERLEYEVGTLRPKEEKRLQLVLKADKAGIVNNLLRAKADAGLEASDQITLEVIAPELEVAISGARTRYLERQVTYEVAVANPGTSTAYEIELVTFLPKGLKYISADNKGSYDPGRHAVYWSLAELPAQESGSVQLTALPIETGEQKLRVEGTANLNLSAKFEHSTNVQALTELAFTVRDVHDPIEVDSETMYEIRIVNNGNKIATNVQIAALLPAELTPLKGEGPTKVIVEGQQVFMEPIERVGPRDEVVYRIAARGVAAGDHVVAVQLASDEVPTPVTKQESTKVYSD